MNVKNFVSDYLESRYNFPHVFITEGCCKRCLRGTPVKYSLEDTTFKELMENGAMEAHQAACSFSCSKFRPGSFANELINVNSAPKPCKYPKNCDLTCIVCRALIEGEEGAELPDVWPGFTAHKQCLGRCAHPCCGKRLPVLPIYMFPQRSDLKCDAHKDTKKTPKAPIMHAKMVPAEPPRQIYQAPKPTRLPPPLQEPRVVPPEPAVKKTFTFKKPATKAKADKFNEKGRSKDILAFFRSPKQGETAEEVVQAVAQSAKEDPPRRFIRNSKTQEIFGFWEGDRAYHIETLEPLRMFNQREYIAPKVKLDFTPPITLTSSIEEEQHKGKARA